MGIALKTFTLYGTSACHLCDQAAALLDAERDNGARFDFERVDISEDDGLFERYGLTIPVLRHPDGRELNWPFEATALGRFLAS